MDAYFHERPLDHLLEHRCDMLTATTASPARTFQTSWPGKRQWHPDRIVHSFSQARLRHFPYSGTAWGKHDRCCMARCCRIV